MQHAAIENSNSTAPMRTGTSFSSVLSSPRLSNQYKTNSFLHSLPGLDLSALKEPLRFIANHRCRKASVNVSKPLSPGAVMAHAAMAHLRNTKIFLKPVSPISGRRRVAPRSAGLGEKALAHA